MNQPGDKSAVGPNESSGDVRRTRPLVPLLLRASEVASLLGLGRSTVFALLADGELPIVRIGRSVRVPRAALERWIDEQTYPATYRGDVKGPLAPDLGDGHPAARASGSRADVWPHRVADGAE